MDPENGLIHALQNVTLEEEENGGLAIEEEILQDENQLFTGFDAKLCIVARFLTEGHVEFQAMQQTLAALWKPGMGVYIKDLEPNLYLFQFYHEIDVKRVMEGCPWSFNRRALVMTRLKEGENPRTVLLNSMDLWVQIYDLKPGFMTERIVQEVGNYIGKFVSSATNNFVGVWRDYLRVRVTIDVTKPLKRRMKIRSAGGEWFWINFKYENVPTFCFICGVLGHSERLCSHLFTTPEAEISKPYGDFMRAPFKRHVKPIGAKWLRNGTDVNRQDVFSGNSQVHTGGGGNNQDPRNTGGNNSMDMERGKSGNDAHPNENQSGNPGFKQMNPNNPSITPAAVRKEISVIETRKRKTKDVLDSAETLGLNTELMDSDDGLGDNENQFSKNGLEASTHGSARLGL